MKYVLGLLGLVGVLFQAGKASAADHQICYQGNNEGTRQTIVVHCRSDAGSACQINLPGALAVNSPQAAGGTVQRYSVPSGTTTVTATITFASGVTRQCTTKLSTKGSAFSNQRAPLPALVSYSTDSSGFAMTGVWQHLPPTALNPMAGTFSVPGDLTVVGGGIVDPNAQGGVFANGEPLVLLDVERRAWVSSTRAASAHANQGYAIGLKIEGIDARTLLSWHEIAQTGVTQPSGSVALPAGRVGVGASVNSALQVNGTSATGQYLLNSSPTTTRLACISKTLPGKLGRTKVPTDPSQLVCTYRNLLASWQGASSDMGANAAGLIKVVLESLPAEINIGNKVFQVQGDVFSATSSAGSAPSVTVTGGEGYALTSVGFAVTPGPNTAFTFTKVLPRADIRGADVAARPSHGANFAITAYVVGIRLVEKVQPPPAQLILPAPASPVRRLNP